MEALVVAARRHSDMCSRRSRRGHDYHLGGAVDAVRSGRWASGPAEWAAFAVLAVASTLHLESARGIERRREMAANTSPHTNLKCLWVFASLLLLPLSLVIPLIVPVVPVLVVPRVRPDRRPPQDLLHVHLHPGQRRRCRRTAGRRACSPNRGYRPSFWSLLVVLAAAATWWLVNYALVIGAILLASPEATARDALGELSDQLVVCAGLGLGVAIAAMQTSYPWVVPVLMVTVLALHRDLLLPQYQRAAGTDVKTGLATPSYWANAVPVELARAETLRSTVGLLMLDLDKFKEINDTYGHPAGDQALEGGRRERSGRGAAGRPGRPGRWRRAGRAAARCLGDRGAGGRRADPGPAEPL